MYGRIAILACHTQLMSPLIMAQVTAYWLSHYPSRIGHHMADRRCKSDVDLERRSRPIQPEGGGAPLYVEQHMQRSGLFCPHPRRCDGLLASCILARVSALAGSGWLWCWRKWSKEERHCAVRRIGTVFATVQLGTIFAASRALRADRKRQRRVVLDLR